LFPYGISELGAFLFVDISVFSLNLS